MSFLDLDGLARFKGKLDTLFAGKLNSSLKGAANGLAELDSNGKVPSSQLPSYVDDVLEYSSLSNFPSTGESGKIYVATDTNKTYRWSGTAYVEISSSLALGETSSTAYRGDRGKTAYDHATAKGSAFTSGLYKITTNAQGHVTAATAVKKADITGLGIPGSDTNTHRPIQVNGTEVLGNNTTALNLKAGSNVTVTNSSGTVTIAATDTTYSSKTAASGGTDVSLVTTGEKYTWNNKANTSAIPTKVSQLTNDSGFTTNTGTITGIKMNGASKGTSGVVDLGTVITAHQTIPTGSTSSAGIVQLTNSTSSTSTTTAATPNSVKSAYDLANGKAAKSSFLSLTASASSWSSSGTITLTASGVTASNNIVVGIGSDATAEQYAAATDAQIMCTAQAANSITLKAFGAVPTVNIPISLIIIG